MEFRGRYHFRSSSMTWSGQIVFLPRMFTSICCKYKTFESPRTQTRSKNMLEPEDFIESENVNIMTSSKENDQELFPLSEPGKEPSSEYQHETAETRPEVTEDHRAWLYVLAGFVTYVNVS